MLIKIYDKIPEEAKMIREAVFMKEQGFKGEFDETDHLAKHVLLFCGDTPVATCRFFFLMRGNAMLLEELQCVKNSGENDMGKGVTGCRKSS